MEISDLRSFLVIARLSNLRAASEELHQTPSALSKAIKRLEESLATSLFDRCGKSLRLNAAGVRLQERAESLLSLADDTAAEFLGRRLTRRSQVLGPSILHSGFGTGVVAALERRAGLSELTFVTCFEDAALMRLAKGEADLALVTATAMHNAAANGVESTPIGRVQMQVAVGRRHALARCARTTMEELLQHDFACMDHSPFCGVKRGGRSDGWRDDLYPRPIRYWVQDLQLQLSLVEAGMAAAYLPDFLIQRHAGLRRIEVVDCPHQCIDEVHIAFRSADHQLWSTAFAADRTARPKKTD